MSVMDATNQVEDSFKDFPVTEEPELDDGNMQSDDLAKAAFRGNPLYRFRCGAGFNHVEDGACVTFDDLDTFNAQKQTGLTFVGRKDNGFVDIYVLHGDDHKEGRYFALVMDKFGDFGGKVVLVPLHDPFRRHSVVTFIGMLRRESYPLYIAETTMDEKLLTPSLDAVDDASFLEELSKRVSVVYADAVADENNPGLDASTADAEVERLCKRMKDLFAQVSVESDNLKKLPQEEFHARLMDNHAGYFPNSFALGSVVANTKKT